MIIILVLCVLICIKLYRKNKENKGIVYVTNKVESINSVSDAGIYDNKVYDDVENTVNTINLQTMNTPSTPSIIVNNAISDLERTITQSSKGD